MQRKMRSRCGHSCLLYNYAFVSQITWISFYPIVKFKQIDGVFFLTAYETFFPNVFLAGKRTLSQPPAHGTLKYLQSNFLPSYISDKPVPAAPKRRHQQCRKYIKLYSIIKYFPQKANKQTLETFNSYTPTQGMASIIVAYYEDIPSIFK